MTIESRVEQAIKNTERNSFNFKQTEMYIEFMQKMKSSDVFCVNKQSVAPINEGGLEQLKLFAQTSIYSK